MERLITEWKLPRKSYQNALSSLWEEIEVGRNWQPEPSKLLRAFNDCPQNKFKVVILGQDPYHTAGVANGLAFSISSHVSRVPPSLSRIARSADCSPYDLESWPAQGVLMLNTALSVEVGKPNSHKEIWHQFTAELIHELLQVPRVVWMLFGKQAQSHIFPQHNRLIFGTIQTEERSYICTPHPSPLSMTGSGPSFEDCDPFGECNRELVRLRREPINWSNK